MSAKPAYGFPWVGHFTLYEAAIVERWREHFTDAQIAAYRDLSIGRGMFDHPTRSHTEVLQYLQRNPRKREEAA